MKKYKDELIRSMKYLSRDKRTIFLGQSVKIVEMLFLTLLKMLMIKKK